MLEEDRVILNRPVSPSFLQHEYPILRILFHGILAAGVFISEQKCTFVGALKSYIDMFEQRMDDFETW